jgi:hypothetical protein
MAKKPKDTLTPEETAADTFVRSVPPDYNLVAAVEMEQQALADEAAPEAGDAEAVLGELEMQWAEDDAVRDIGIESAASDSPDERFADWYVGKTLAIKAEIQLLKDQHEKRLKALQGRLNGVQRYAAVKVEAFLHEKLATKGGKGKFIDLPHGRLGFRAKAATVEYSNNADRVRQFAEEYAPAAEAYAEYQPPPKPEVKMKPLVAAVQAWMAEHGGEEPAGFLYVAPRDGMYVDPPK